jgi:hypothetical protein
MAVERESHSTSTRAARDEYDEETGSQRRGSRRIALAGTSRAHVDDWAGGIDGIDTGSNGIYIGGISDSIDISGVSGGHKEIGTRRTRRRSRACLPVH